MILCNNTGYYYIRAHYNLENGSSEEFVSDIYHIWIDVVLTQYSRESLNYLRFLKGQQPVEPISLYMRYSPTLKRLIREQMKKNKKYLLWSNFFLNITSYLKRLI